MGITDTQSYSLVIRDIFFNAVTPDPFFADYTCRKNKMLVARPEYLPYLGIYIVDETMTPDGDPNATFVRFSHTLRVGFSVMVANNDQDIAETQIDAAFWRIMNILWPSNIMNFFGIHNPDNVAIESITRGTRRHVFGNAMLNNETPIAEMQYDVSCFYRTMWWPTITDDFRTLDIKTGIKIGDTPTEMAQRQQLEAIYTFDPPTVTAIAPTSGPVAGGTAVTITGTNFIGVTSVQFGDNYPADITAVSATSITATSPLAFAGTVDVTVTTPNGTSATSPADQFTYS